MSNSNIYTKTGALSAYGLACGYVQNTRWINDGDKAYSEYAELYNESGIYHVRYINHIQPIPINQRAIRVWNSYEKISEARAFYRQIEKAIGRIK